MCERCGFSGCNHDWKRWAPATYSRGFSDGNRGLEADPLSEGGTEWRAGYVAGYREGRRWYEIREGIRR